MMAAPEVVAVLVDDDPVEREVIADLLGTGSVQVIAVPPGRSAEETVATVREVLPNEGARVVLLDYRLEDHDLGEGQHAHFRGGTIAGFLRDTEPELPVVLLTSDKKLRESVDRRPGMREVFDWTVLKNDVSDSKKTDGCRARVADLARAWWELLPSADEQVDVWPWLSTVMRVDQALLIPFAEQETHPPRTDAPGDAVRWLLAGPLTWNGPLADDDQARVLLGVARESFDSDAVQEWIEPARYQGPLQAFGRRWWTAVLRAQLAEAADGIVPAEASKRAEIVASAVRRPVEPEQCDWCGGERTVRACSICGRATDAAHAVRRLTDPAPSWADLPVVCYGCVEEGRADSEGVRFPPEAEEVVEAIREEQLTRPAHRGG